MSAHWASDSSPLFCLHDGGVVDSARAAELLLTKDLQRLFIDELLWDLPRRRPVRTQVGDVPTTCHPIAEKGTIPALLLVLPPGQLRSVRRDLAHLHRSLRSLAYEHLLICSDSESSEMLWSYPLSWLGRDAIGTCAVGNGHRRQQSMLVLQQLSFDWEDLDADGRASPTAVRRRLERAFTPAAVRTAQRFLRRARGYVDVLADGMGSVPVPSHRYALARLTLARLAVASYLEQTGHLGDRPGHLCAMCTASERSDVPLYHAFVGPMLKEGLGHPPDEREPSYGDLLTVGELTGGLFTNQPVEEMYPNLNIDNGALCAVLDWLAEELWRPGVKLPEINGAVIRTLVEETVRRVPMVGSVTAPRLPAPRARWAERDSIERVLYLASRTGLLSADQETDLARLARLAPDAHTRRAARRLLIEANYRLVMSIARRYARSATEPVEDLFQEGAIGLVKAVDKFDPQLGYRLSTYATWWIRQSIQRYLDEEYSPLHPPVHVTEQRRLLFKRIPELALELRREPILDEVVSDDDFPLDVLRSLRPHVSFQTELCGPDLGEWAATALDESGWPRDPAADDALMSVFRNLSDAMEVDGNEEWDDALCDDCGLSEWWERSGCSFGPVEPEALLGEDQSDYGCLPQTLGAHLAETVSDGVDSGLDHAANVVLQDQLARILSSLAERERAVLKLRFGLDDGRERTLEQVAEVRGVTRERVRQIEAKALKKLRHPSRNRRLRDYRYLGAEAPAEDGNESQPLGGGLFQQTVTQTEAVRDTLDINLEPPTRRCSGPLGSYNDFIAAVCELADEHQVFIGTMTIRGGTMKVVMTNDLNGHPVRFAFPSAFKAKFAGLVAWRNMNSVDLLESLGY